MKNDGKTKADLATKLIRLSGSFVKKKRTSVCEEPPRSREQEAGRNFEVTIFRY